jgi:hypothetical protein
MQINEKLVREFYKALAHSYFTEIRTIHPFYKSVRSFTIADEEEFVRKVVLYNGREQLYVGINERNGNGTKLSDVMYVSNIVIDIDAVRAAGFEKQMATESELRRATAVADEVSEYLVAKGFKKPMRCCSGNGYSLWMFIPRIHCTDENREMLNTKMQLFHSELIEKFSDGKRAKIDQVGDLPRIIRIPGTFNMKGESKQERPHRWSYCSEKQFVRNEDPKLKAYILGLEATKKAVVQTIVKPRNLSDDQKIRRKELADGDKHLNALFKGGMEKPRKKDSVKIELYKSRSEAEMAVMFKLVALGYNKTECFNILEHSETGKWNERPDAYRELTYKKAAEMVKQGRTLKSDKNPYRDCAYEP